MKYDIKIYGITDRIDQIKKNADILHLSPDDLNIIVKDGSWVYPLMKETWLKPWSEDTTHRLVLQDDAELCPDFEKRLQQAIEARPDDILFLTALDYDKQNDAVEGLESPYLRLNFRVQGCAIVIPTKYIEDVFKWCEEKYGDDMFNGKMHEDSAIVFYGWSHKGIEVLTTLPSLTQHIGDHSSLFGYDKPTRTYYFKDWDKADYTNGKISIPKRTMTNRPPFYNHGRKR